jgi:hypothetical protein
MFVDRQFVTATEALTIRAKPMVSLRKWEIVIHPNQVPLNRCATITHRGQPPNARLRLFEALVFVNKSTKTTVHDTHCFVPVLSEIEMTRFDIANLQPPTVHLWKIKNPDRTNVILAGNHINWN